MQSVVVLVVEDEALMRMELETILQEAGFESKAAGTGRGAIDILENTQDIRAIVTDVNLGNSFSGWDVARRARELIPDLPIVYATSVSSAEWSANGVPGSLLVTKPYVSAQIITGISQLLNAHDSQLEANAG